MAETEQMNNWYRKKDEQLNRNIKRCKTLAVITGAVATLGSLVVAENIVNGNGLEVLQVGGITAAMASYLIGYSKLKSIYEKEPKELKEIEPKSFARERLATLKSGLEINKTWLGMDYLVAGSFYTSALGHILEVISMPGEEQLVFGMLGAATSGIGASLSSLFFEQEKRYIAKRQNELEQLETEIELEETSKQPITELVEPQDTLVVVTPTEEQQEILQLKHIPNKK